MSKDRWRALLLRTVAFVFGLCFAYVAQAGEEAAPHPDAWLAAHAHALTDLDAFGAAIGDRPLVALAESSHGDGNGLALKTRLVEYLHERKGFDVLFLESGLYDVSEIWRLAQGGSSVTTQGPGNIFFMYSKSREGRALLDYVDRERAGAHPLILAGIDAQHSGGLALKQLPIALTGFLKARRSGTAEASGWNDYLTLVHQLVAFDRTPPSAERQAAFFAIADRLEGELCAPQADSLHFPDSPGWWCRIARSLHIQAQDYWRGTQLRDTAMAENLQWLVENPYKGHKAMLWAHVAHSARFTRPDTGNRSMGQVLSGFYGDRYYVATVTVQGGTILDFETMKAASVVPAPADSLEAALARLGKPALFLDLHDGGVPDAVAAAPRRFFEYQYLPVDPRMIGVDGVFYLQTAAPAEMID